MNRMYAMRRANGDWFALDDRGHLRVPLFHSRRGAMHARACHPGMVLFSPVELDERTLEDLATVDGNCLVSFWLVEGPPAKLDRVYPLEHGQIALLVNGTGTKAGRSLRQEGERYYPH
jgi:hypothetical protein